MHDLIIYVVSFLGLFISSFYILTLLSSGKKRYRLDPSFTPKVSIIVPVWNEEKRIKRTLDSLLALDYPNLEIIVVDDGSTDRSLEIVKGYKVKVFSHKISKGKTMAINTGMKAATGELVAGLDADSTIESDVLRKLVPCFKNHKVMAAIPSIKIWNPKTFLERIQAQEFLSAVLIRHIQSELGSIPMAPGAFTLVRKEFIDKHGGLSHKTMVEDLELSLRIQSKHYLIENVIDANVYTGGVKTFKAFYSQRLRWFYGFLIQIWRYRRLFDVKYGNLGVFILPFSILFIALTLLIFSYSFIMAAYNTFRWISDILLVGFDFTFEPNLDPFFFIVDNTTLIPFMLLFIALGLSYYIKRASDERQGILLNFVLFSMTYWFLGALSWFQAIYYYIRKKRIRWGPNYFSR